MEIIFLLAAFIVITLLGAYLRSPAVKGARGEKRVNRVLDRQLPSREYRTFHNITLESSHGPTQIDHIVVSRYGVFVIETKNYDGWIFGDAKSKQWTQTIYGHKSRFQNPLHQNYKHVKAVQSFLSLSPHHVYSVVVFVGNATFKTNLPDNVTYYRELCPYILSRKEKLLDSMSVRAMASALEDHKEGRNSGATTSASVDDEPSCQNCGERMVVRKACGGKHAGNNFWVCPRFPECRGIREITATTKPTRTIDP